MMGQGNWSQKTRFTVTPHIVVPNRELILMSRSYHLSHLLYMEVTTKDRRRVTSLATRRPANMQTVLDLTGAAC